jgi:hypothetical protein
MIINASFKATCLIIIFDGVARKAFSALVIASVLEDEHV